MAWALQSPANRQPYPPLATTSAPLVGLRADRSDATDAPAKKPLPGYQLAPALTRRLPVSDVHAAGDLVGGDARLELPVVACGSGGCG